MQRMSVLENETPQNLSYPPFEFISQMEHRQPKLTVALRNNLYIHKDFVWKLLDRVIYKTLHGNPLDFSKIYDIVTNDEIKLTNLLFGLYFSVLCSLGSFTR